MSDLKTSKIILTTKPISVLENLEARDSPQLNMEFDFGNNDHREEQTIPMGATDQEDDNKSSNTHASIAKCLKPLINELKEALPLIKFNFITAGSIEKNQIKRSLQLKMKYESGLESTDIETAQQIIMATFNEANRIIKEINQSVENKDISQVIICSNPEKKKNIQYVNYLNKNSSLLAFNIFNTLQPVVFLLAKELTIGQKTFKFEDPIYQKQTITSASTESFRGTICLESVNNKSFIFNHGSEEAKNKKSTMFCEENHSNISASLFEELKQSPPNQLLLIEVRENSKYVIHEDHFKPKLLIISFKIIQADLVQIASAN